MHTDLETLTVPDGFQVHESRGTYLGEIPYRWVEVAASWTGGRCPDCDQPTGPAWDWVDTHGGNLAPEVRGAWGDGQCGGCGQLGRGWATSGAVDITDVDDPQSVVDRLVADVRSRAAVQLHHAIDELRGRLADDLAEAVDEFDRLIAAGVDPDDAAAQVATGDDVTPGVQREADGQWVAWGMVGDECVEVGR